MKESPPVPRDQFFPTSPAVRDLGATLPPQFETIAIVRLFKCSRTEASNTIQGWIKAGWVERVARGRYRRIQSRWGIIKRITSSKPWGMREQELPSANSFSLQHSSASMVTIRILPK